MKKIVVHGDNIAKHGITRQEVEQCFRSGNRQFKRKAGHDVYSIIAQTSAGRYLELLYSDDPDKWFVFHARDAKPWEIKLFKRKGKRQ
jgi:hypothetical protein